VNQDRKIIFHGKHFMEFYIMQTQKVQEKIDFVLKIVRTVERIPKTYFKHLTGTDGIYEIRVECEGNIYRILCCFDEGNLVILFNSFQKKTPKTPSKEIAKAAILMIEYFAEKNIKEKTIIKTKKDEERKRK
jgi:phage-related protein